MRILNNDKDEKINGITIYLTRSEAQELQDSMRDLLDNANHQHSHVPSEDYQKEVTICIYDVQDLQRFDERSKKLILEDE